MGGNLPASHGEMFNICPFCEINQFLVHPPPPHHQEEVINNQSRAADDEDQRGQVSQEATL